MASSDSVDFELVRNDLIQEAMYSASVLAVGETATAEELFSAVRLLDMMTKAWSGSANALQRGVKVWARKRATLYLEKGTAIYSLGATGDHASRTVVETTLSVAAAAGAASITVADATGISDGDYLGVVLDDGTLEWDVVNGDPAANVITLTGTLASAAASGNAVVSYTIKINRPDSIISVILKDSDDNERQLAEMSLDEYQALGRKNDEGAPTRYFYEAQLTNGVLYLDFAADDVTSKLQLVYLTPLSDFDSLDDDPEFPQEWFEALHYNLAVRLCIAYGRPVPPELERMAASSLALANEFHPENTDQYFQPGLD